MALVASDGTVSAAFEFRTADVALFMATGLVHVLEAFENRLDNVYLAVRDALTGRLAYEHAFSAEFHSGASVVLPALEDCVRGVSLGGAIGYVPPPCPVSR